MVMKMCDYLQIILVKRHSSSSPHCLPRDNCFERCVMWLERSLRCVIWEICDWRGDWWFDKGCDLRDMWLGRLEKWLERCVIGEAIGNLIWDVWFERYVIGDTVINLMWDVRFKRDSIGNFIWCVWFERYVIGEIYDWRYVQSDWKSDLREVRLEM